MTSLSSRIGAERTRSIAARIMFLWIVIDAGVTYYRIGNVRTGAEEPTIYFAGIFWALVGIGLGLSVILGARDSRTENGG